MMNPKRCAVTGAKGYLGSRIVQRLRREGWQVVEMSRDIARSECGLPYSLDGKINPDDLRQVDALVHCAHDFNARSDAEMRRINVDGTLRLFHAARAAGVARVVFISSMAAFEGCRSAYGRVKLEIEHAAAKQCAWVVRPGTIYGKGAGGLLGAMRRVVSKLPMVPLIGSGKSLVYLVHEDDLCELLLALCEGRVERGNPEPISAAARNPMTFARLLRALAAAEGKGRLFVPVPWRLVHAGLKFVEALGLRPGLRSDSVLSLIHYNPNADFVSADQRGFQFREFTAKDL